MDRAIIYVAGNPDLYPVEYYDTKTQSYQGAIPEFLAEFAEEYGYDLRYLQPGAKDHRAELADKQQVDLLSGCTNEEQYTHTVDEPVLLFSGGEDETVYTLWMTQVSSNRFQEDLREYATETTQADWTGALLEAAGEQTPARLSVGVLVGAGLVTLALLIALFASLFRFRKEKKRMVQQAQIDPESGLGTLAALEHHYARMEKDQSRRSYSLVCIHLALDPIGWLWGYERANKLFMQGVQALRDAAEPGDILARSGSDFLVLKCTTNPQKMERWVKELLEQIRIAGDLRPQDVAAGIYPLTAEFCDFEHALFHVRQCAQAVSREGRSIRLYNADQCQNCRERWNLLDDFSKALERQEFQLYCQFFVDAGTFRVVGGETLSRWHHPRFGLLSPLRYIPLLEETGRIEELDFYGLEKACAFLEELCGKQIFDFFLSCNVSRKTFSTLDFAQRCIQVIHRYSFPRKLLILEITESQQTDSRETEQMYQNIQSIRASGMRVIFDDFGVGFSSFHDLQTYPMDGLKLSKKLVDNMQTENGKQILRALVDIGHHMGLTILAEGVEHEGQIEALRTLHCDALQGFRFFVPLPEEEAQRRILHGDRALKDRSREEEEQYHDQ